MAERNAPRHRAWPRRGDLGQHFLADAHVVRRFVDSLDLADGELVVDLGAGSGALTDALLDRGATVLAVEIDPRWVAFLHRRRRQMPAGERRRLQIVDEPIEHVALPREPYRVVANPPFGATTTVLKRLLDDPRTGPWRADLIVQREVARKRAAPVPDTLLGAGWSPWWTMRMGMPIDRRSFDPPPRVDAAVLIIEPRTPPALPLWLAPDFAELIRRRWERGP